MNPIDATTFNSSLIKTIYTSAYSQSSYYNNIPPFPFRDPEPVAIADPNTDNWGGQNGDGSLPGYAPGNSFWFMDLMTYYNNSSVSFEADPNHAGWTQAWESTTGHYVWVGPDGEISY